MPDSISSAAVAEALDVLINDCRKVLSVPGAGPETSLYRQFDSFFAATLGQLPGFAFLQQVNANQAGIPDFRVHDGNELQGWIEIKAVINKDLGNLQGDDATQQQRFVAGLDNLIYTDGWQWRLYQHGRQIGPEVLIGPAALFDPKSLPYTVPANAVTELVTLLENFAAASQQSYPSPAAAVSALAARAKALKLALLEIGRAGAGPHLAELDSDFRALLFKNGMPFSWQKFVDSYVQLAVFGGLLWRLETGQQVTLAQQVGVSVGLHPLLAQCLAILWSPQSRVPILEPLLEELCRTINNIEPDLFTPPAASGKGRRRYLPDPIVHAYEPFFSAYDPATRESSGVYYTPVEIVEQIVSGAAHLMSASLGITDNLLDEGARFLDPATGTGTFLIGLANGVAAQAADQGLPIDQTVQQVMTNQTSAFELFPGPYAIAHQRLEVALKSFGAQPAQRLPIYLADTLEAPATGQLPNSGFGLAGIEIQHERQRADELKTADELTVILGNPPYERILETKGGVLEPFAQALLNEVKSRTPLDHRADLKSTKDLYVAFWAWALWALQRPATRTATAAAPTIDTRDCHGLIGFITNRTWFVGRSLIGLRELMREGAKEIWILDLGGDARGAHGATSFAGGDANVFDIQTGVAITWAVFDRAHSGPVAVRYRRLFGTKANKLDELAQPFDPNRFELLRVGGGEAFLPNMWGGSPVGNSPRLDELFVDQPETGLQTARDKKPHSPIGTEAAEVLAWVQGAQGKRLEGRLGEWSRLGSNQRAAAWATAQSSRAGLAVPSVGSLDPAKLRPFAYRPFDVRWLYDDPSWIDWWRPGLQRIYADGPVPSLVTLPGDHGNGPAVLHVDTLMDQHSFRGSDGGKGVFSLWHPHLTGEPVADPRTPGRDGKRCGFSGIVYDWLASLGRADRVQAAYDYLLAVLSAPSYTENYWRALEADFLRVPLTTDAGTFDSAASLGAQLREIWELRAPRLASIRWAGSSAASPLGKATRTTNALRFANGRELLGISDAAWRFQISNFPVLPRWFAARQHWTATTAQARMAQQVASAVDSLVNLNTQLDSLLARATATC